MRAFEIRSAHLERYDPLLLAAAAEASDSALEYGKYAEAAKICCFVLDAPIPSSYASDAGYLERRSVLQGNLASAYSRQHKHAEAEAILQELIPQREATGDLHQLDTLYSNLAMCLEARGDLEGALSMSQRALDLSFRSFGNRSRNAAICRLNHAGMLLSAGRTTEAVQLLRETLAIYDIILDRSHPWRFNAATGLVSALHKAGSTREANATAASEMPNLPDYGAAALWVFTTLDALISGLETGDASAVAILRKVGTLATDRGPSRSRIMEKVGNVEGHFTSDQMIINGTLVGMRAVCAAAGSHAIDDAEAGLLLQALRHRIHDPPPAWTLVDEGLRTFWPGFKHDKHNLDAHYQTFRHLLLTIEGPSIRTQFTGAQTNDPATLKDDIAALEKRRAEERRKSGQYSDETAQFEILLASRYGQAGRHRDAVKAQMTATKIAQKLFGKGSSEYAVAQLNLGSVVMAGGDAKAAFDCYRKGLLLVDKNTPPERLAGPLSRFVECTKKSGRHTEGAKALCEIGDRLSAPSVAFMARIGAAGAFLASGQEKKGLQQAEAAVTTLCLLQEDTAEATRFVGQALSGWKALLKSRSAKEAFCELEARVARLTRGSELHKQYVA